jgi:hypothetical protein
VQAHAAIAAIEDRAGHMQALGSSDLPPTLAAGDNYEQLEAEISNMALSQPPLLFANRFLFTTDFVRGGQALVVFARGRDAGLRQYAIKCSPRLLRTPP